MIFRLSDNKRLEAAFPLLPMKCEPETQCYFAPTQRNQENARSTIFSFCFQSSLNEKMENID
jgi:hypothetical protein